jgi:hypothetical protein
MVIMGPLPRTAVSPKTRLFQGLFLHTLIPLLCTCGTLPSVGYVLENSKWPNSTVIFHLQLGTPNHALLDGSTSWNTAASPAFGMWNAVVGGVRMATVATSSAVGSHDGVNSVAFSSTVFGQSFGSHTLAVTYRSFTQNQVTVEADVLFNRAQQFDSYRGALRFGSNGYAIADIRRVLLHELGHALGLDHPDTHGQHVAAVMNSIISNQETVSADDKAGVQSLYGAPSSSPPPAPSRLINISTRLKVGTNDDVLIGGFVISGTQSKRILLRAIGPSLAASGIIGALSNPMLELHGSGGALIASNDNWQQSTQASEIRSTSLPPSEPLESAMVATLAPGSYTAIVRGVNGTTGIAMIEGYELGATGARLVNISTRGRVGFGNDVLIGGFVIQGSSGKRILMRALGPSLASAGVGNVLANPVLELHNAAGALLSSNDNWQSNQWAAQISATGLAPSNTRESAIIATLVPGNYTAIMRGVNNTTGVGLVELYDLDQ